MGRFIDITGAPIVSDFQEMPLDFMAKALSAKQAAYDKQDLEAAGIPGLIPEGFIATKGYKDILTKELNPKLADWSKRAIADPEGVGRDIAKYKSQLATDARYRLLAADTAKKAEYLKDLKETNKLGKAYEKAFDYTTGQYKGPIDPDKLLKGEVTGDLEDFYSTPIYGDVHKDYTENLKNIKEISIEDVSTLFPGINQYGDQLKTTKTVKVDSNSIYDTTEIGKDENGNPITIGEVTKRKVHQISDAILANNSVAAQYANTPLSPFRILEDALPEGASIIDKGRAYGEYVFSPMSKQSRTNKNEIVSFGTNAFDAIGKREDQERIAVPGQKNYNNDADGFRGLITDTYNTKMDYANKLVSRMSASGALGKDYIAQMQAIAYYSNPANLDKLMTEYSTKLSAYETKIRNGQAINKDDYTYTKSVKDDLNGLINSMQAEAKLTDRFVNKLEPLLKKEKETLKIFEESAWPDADAINTARNTVKALEDALHKINSGIDIPNVVNSMSNPTMWGDNTLANMWKDLGLDDVITSSVKPIYSVTTGKGVDTGTINVVQKAITNSWGQNMSLFEGQDKELTPQKWLKDQLGADDKTNIQLVGASIDGDGKWVATYKADNDTTKSFVYKDQGELESLKKTTIQDLRRSGDQNAIQFANMVSFKDELKANNQQGKWLSLAQAKPTLQKPVTVTIKLPDMQGNLINLDIKKAVNTVDGSIYYEYGGVNANSLDELEMKLGQYTR